MNEEIRSVMESIKVSGSEDEQVDMASSSSSSSGSDCDMGGCEEEDEERSHTPPRLRISTGCYPILERVLGEEEELKRKVKGLKEELAKANRLIVGKETEIRELKERKKKLMMKERGQEDQGQRIEERMNVEEVETVKKKSENGENGMFPNPKDAVVIFPEELWEMILKELDDPNDLWNSSKTCGLFKKLLPPKGLYLFDLLFPIIFKYMEPAVILKCRLVCHRWNKIVDEYFENHPSLTPPPLPDVKTDPRSPPFTTPMEDKQMGLYRFSNYRNDLRQRKFTRKMKDHPRNPFIGRHISIVEFDTRIPAAEIFLIEEAAASDSDEEDVDDEAEVNGQQLQPYEIHQRRFYKKLNKFMDTFGQHIWYVTFSSEINNQSFLGRKCVHEFLAGGVFYHCPNLRKIQVGGYLPDFYRWGIVDQTLMNYPPTPHLETIQLDELVYSLEQPIFDIFTLGCTDHLRSLHLKRERLNNRMFRKAEWTQLTELHLSMFGVDGELEVVLGLKLPQLRKLRLTLDKKGITNRSFKILLETLNKLSKTSPHLCALRLNTGFPEEPLLSLPPSLFAPSTLTTLELENTASSESHCGYTFLLRFPFLENLNVYWSTAGCRCLPIPGRLEMLEYRYADQFEYHEGIEEMVEHEVVQLHRYMYRERMYESNVWEVLPCLKVFTFQREAYTRHGYEEFSDKRNRR